MSYLEIPGIYVDYNRISGIRMADPTWFWRNSHFSNPFITKDSRVRGFGCRAHGLQAWGQIGVYLHQVCFLSRRYEVSGLWLRAPHLELRITKITLRRSPYLTVPLVSACATTLWRDFMIKCRFFSWVPSVFLQLRRSLHQRQKPFKVQGW